MTDIAWFAPAGGVMMVSILSHKLCVAVLIAAFALPLTFVVWRAIAGTGSWWRGAILDTTSPLVRGRVAVTGFVAFASTTLAAKVVGLLCRRHNRGRGADWER